MMRRALLLPSSLLSSLSFSPCRSILRKRGGLPALAASPGLTQGIGRAEDLQKRLYEAQYKEAKAEDFDNPRSEEDGAQEMLNEYRRMRAQNQEVCKRIDATPEYQAYDEQLSFEINCLEETFYHRIHHGGMPVTKENLETLNDARETICKYYFEKHAPFVSPIAKRINREVMDEIASGKLVIGEADDKFVSDLYDRRQKQEQNPLVASTVVKDYGEAVRAGEEEGERSDVQLLIDKNWDQDELDKQREMAFVKTRRRGERGGEEGERGEEGGEGEGRGGREGRRR